MKQRSEPEIAGVLPGYERKQYLLTGLPPGLIMDNGDRADPLDPIAQKISALRDGTPPKKRTMEYHSNLAKLTFIGSMWTSEIPQIVEDKTGTVVGVDGDAILVAPGNAINGMMVQALGRQGRGRLNDARIALVVDEYYPLLIGGETKTAHQIFTARDAFEQYVRFAIRQRVRNKSGQWVTATRAYFREWSVEIQFQFVKKLFDGEKIDAAIRYAGEVLGLGTSRSRQYGRFEVQPLKG